MNLRELRRSSWAIPTLLAIGCLTALIVALAADGIWDVLSWGVLAIPLAIVGITLMKREPADRPPPSE